MLNWKPFKDAKLATRSTLIFSLGLLTVLAVSLGLVSHFYLQTLLTAEQASILKSLGQAQQLIAIKQNQLDRSAADWANWDETYQLVTQGDPGYADRNLNTTTLENLDVDLMVFVTRTGRFREGVYLAEGEQQVQPVPVGVRQELLSAAGIGVQLGQLRERPDVRILPYSGMISLQGMPTLITILPIHDSYLQEPVGGWLIWGKRVADFFPQRYQGILSDEAQLLVQEEGEAMIKATPSLALAPSAAHVIRDRDTIHALAQLTTLNGKPLSMLQVSADRSLYREGKQSLLLLNLLCLGCGGGLGFLFWGLFRNSVMQRFTHLESGLQQLLANDFSLPLVLDGQDEIATVGKVVNKLMATRDLANQALKEFQANFEALYEGSSQGMLIVDDHHILSANTAAWQLLGYESSACLLSQRFDDLFAEEVDGSPFSVADFRASLQQGQHVLAWELIGNCGWRVPCELDITPIHHQGRQVLLICIRDTYERLYQADRIKRLAWQDRLTGLLNRYRLRQLIRKALEEVNAGRGGRFALLCANLDGFKTINATYGHGVGDDVLRIIAERLRAGFPDVQLARIANDEFVLFMPDVDNAYLSVRLGQRIQRLLSPPMLVSGRSLELSASVGILVGGDEFSSADEALRCANLAVAKAKQTGQKLVLFSAGLHAEAMEAVTIKRDLAAAIRCGQIEFAFQPVVDCQSNRVVGLEALARWQHPELGLVPPSKFIPIAEENHLIIELGEYLLPLACRFVANVNRQLTAAGLPSLAMHVNLSASHFASSSLIQSLKDALQQSGIDSHQLVIELTESMLIKQPVEAIRQMMQIKHLGCGLALDDFGTGYSALSTLSQYPLDVVKLDRSFVLRLMDGGKGELLVKGILNMARDLNLKVVAEGVETREQMEKLAALGVREIQGFYYYRPLPETELLNALFGARTAPQAEPCMVVLSGTEE